MMFLFSCDQSRSELEVKSFKIADSLYQANTSIYFIEADSLCNVMRSNFMVIWVDSLLSQRKKEVEALRQ